MTINNLITRVNELITMGDNVIKTSTSDDYIDSGLIKGFRSASLSFIERVYDKKHSHYIEFDNNTKGYYSEDAKMGVAILHAIKSELDGGWLFSMKGLITAEVFSSFLEMAEHLLKKGYKDSAAVMIGSVLEEHLRQLCLKNDIPIEIEKDEKIISLKADRLNADLVKSDIYSKLDQKMITAWLDLRNKAAHGKYNEYEKKQVEHMLLSVTELMARIPV